MIRIEHTEVLGWEAAIRGMRNPMNSWDKTDSYWGLLEEPSPINPDDEPFFFVGDNDLDLMKRLCKAGTDHRKFMRMIVVYCDITAPLYWWKEFDTYKVGTVSNSCSTMHKIHSKEFTRDDFSMEHLLGDDVTPDHAYQASTYVMDETIQYLNFWREEFLEHYPERTQFDLVDAKDAWWQMIQMLPTSYNQKRTVMLNYEVLANIYKSRKNHKLDCWRELCSWITSLPYSEIITGEE